MKKFTKKTIAYLLAITLCLTSILGLSITPASAASPSILYQPHVQNVGWMGTVADGSDGGTTGQGLRLEALKMQLRNIEGWIKASAHVANIGWMNYVSANSGSWLMIGTTGRSLAIEAVKIELCGAAANSYDIVYRIHSQNIGWGDWVRNGAVAGSTGRGLRAEAIQIKLVAKSNSTTTSTYYVNTNGGNLNVRSGPSTGYTSIGKLANGTALQVYSINNGWAKIQYGSGKGYVSSSYLTQAKPNVITSSGWQWPVTNRRVTQVFGAYNADMQRSKGRGYHCGIDIGDTNYGSPAIYAAASGTIKYRGTSSSNGNHIVIQHNINGQTVYSFYAHLSNFNGCSSVGSTVNKGQQIGTMGSTGNSTGTHLHFGIFTGSYSSDPIGYSTKPSNNKVTYNGITFYDPTYVINNSKLP